MTTTLEALRTEIEREASKLEQLRRNLAIAEREMAKLTPAQCLAITLHSKFGLKQDDDWYYNCTTVQGVTVVKDWNGHAQRSWLAKANLLIKHCAERHVEVQDFLDILEAVQITY